MQAWRSVIVSFFKFRFSAQTKEYQSKRDEMQANHVESDKTTTTTNSNANAFKVPTKVLKLPICKQHDFVMNSSRLSFFFHVSSSSSHNCSRSGNLLFSSSFTIYTREILFFFSEWMCVCVCICVQKACKARAAASISFRKKTSVLSVCRFTFSADCSELKRPPLFMCTRGRVNMSTGECVCLCAFAIE